MDFLAGGLLGFGIGWLACSLALYIFVKIKGKKDNTVKED